MLTCILQYEMANRGIHTSISTVQRAVRSIGMTYQAISWRTPPRDMSSELKVFFAEYDKLVEMGANIMSVDETGVLSNRYTLRGYGKRGKRLRIASLKQKRFKATCIVGITNNEEAFVHSVEGNVNGQTFNEFMAFALADAPPFTVVILDNIAFHKSATVRRIAEQHGVRLLYTPAYSPECKPVEHFFAAFKTVIKRRLLSHPVMDPGDFVSMTHGTLEELVKEHVFEGYFGPRIRERQLAIHTIHLA